MPGGMFWRVAGFTQPSPIETILDKENFNLEELLDEDDLIQVLVVDSAACRYQGCRAAITRNSRGSCRPTALTPHAKPARSLHMVSSVVGRHRVIALTASAVPMLVAAVHDRTEDSTFTGYTLVIPLRNSACISGELHRGMPSMRGHLQECKALNGRLINFLRERSTVEKLLRYLVQNPDQNPGTAPTSDADSKQQFKYPYAACEVGPAGACAHASITDTHSLQRRNANRLRMCLVSAYRSSAASRADESVKEANALNSQLTAHAV